MKNHTKIYFNALGLYPEDGCNCEICNQRAVDIHHIERRGMGGTTNPEKDSIFNLIAVCRECHDRYGDKVKYKRSMKVKHMRFLMQRGSQLLGIFQEVNFKENGIEFIGENL